MSPVALEWGAAHKGTEGHLFVTGSCVATATHRAAAWKRWTAASLQGKRGPLETWRGGLILQQDVYKCMPPIETHATASKVN